MNYQEFKDKVFEQARACGLTEYELYYEQSQSTDVDAFGEEIKGFSSSDNAGACFRCVCGGHIGYASTSLFTEEEAERLVEATVENARSMEKEEPALFCKGGQEYRQVTPKEVRDIPTSRMVELAKQSLKLCREEDARVSGSSEASLMVSHSVICLDNSNGVHLQDTVHMGAVVTQTVVKENEEVSYDVGFRFGSPEEIDLGEMARDTVQKALDKLGAGVPDSGVFSLVLSPEAMTSMLGAFSPAFSGENAQNGLSLMKGRENTKVAADCVTLMDDPFYEESFYRPSFDGEGTPSQCKAVIEDGVLKTLLYDLATAAKAGVETTGNAARATFSSPIAVRPTNFYIRPGTVTPEEMYAQIGDGLLITSVQGLHAGASAVTGDFSLQSSGFLIRGGRKDRPVKSFTIAGNFYEMLKKIAAVGNDMKFNCMRGIGAPSVLVEGITVSGK